MLGFDSLGRLALGQLEDHARNLTIEPGVFVLTGGAVQSTRLHADAGDFALTGQSVTLKATRRLAIAAGTFALSGQTAGLHRALRLTADLGGFTFTGNTVELSRFRPLVADPGSFVLTGQAVSLKATRAMPVGIGSFALTGNAAGLMSGRVLGVGAGSFVWTGVDVRLLAARRLAISPVPAVVAGNSATPAFTGFAALGEVALGQANSSAAVTFMLRGMTLALRKGRTMTVEAGAFALTGKAARLLQGDRAITVNIRQASARNFKGRPSTATVPAHVATQAGSTGFKARASVVRR